MPTGYSSRTRLGSETRKSQWHTERSQGGIGVEQICSSGPSQHSINIHLQISWLGTNFLDAAGSLEPHRGEGTGSLGQFTGKIILSHGCQPASLTVLRSTLLSCCDQEKRLSSLTREIWMQLNVWMQTQTHGPNQLLVALNWRTAPRNSKWCTKSSSTNIRARGKTKETRSHWFSQTRPKATWTKSHARAMPMCWAVCQGVVVTLGCTQAPATPNTGSHREANVLTVCGSD